MGRTWKDWDKFEWNEKLFIHYLSKKTPEIVNISSLSVSSEDLKIVAQDPTADPNEVLKSLIKAVKGSLLGDKNGPAFKNALASCGKYKGLPLSFAYLILSCLAANQVIEDEESDTEESSILGDFRRVMAELLSVERVDIDESLADAWRELAKFLDENRSIDHLGVGVIEFNRLVLPDPGIEVHIGYSKKIVFPSRRDQLKLIEVLLSAALVEENPPVEKVLKEAARKRNLFSPSFRKAIDDFAKSFASGVSFAILLQDKFWNAVLGVCSNEILLKEKETLRLSILVEISGDSPVSYFVFTNHATVSDPLVVSPTSDFEGWSFQILHKDESIDPATHIFSNKTGSSVFDSLVKGGVVPFLKRPDRYLEIATPSLLAEVKWVLVRRDCSADFLRMFDGQIDEDAYCPHPDWLFVKNPTIRSLKAEDLESTTLSGASVLFKRIIKPTLRIVSHFNIGSDFLGWADLLPTVQAPDADAVELSIEGSKVTLKRHGDGWLLPKQDLYGEATITAVFGDFSSSKEIRFVKMTVSDDFKMPSNSDALMIENNSGMEILSHYKARSSVEEMHEIPNAVRRLYLGNSPGEFVSKADEAVVEVTYFGDSSSFRVLNESLLSTSKIKVNDDGLVRKWRKLISVFAGSSDADSYTAELRRMTIPRSDYEVCDPVDGFSHLPTPYEDDPIVKQKRNVLLTAAAARSLKVKGIPIRMWMGMLHDFLGVDWPMNRYVHRAWLEAGLIDEYASVRSPGLNVYARKPRMEVFKNEDSFCCAVTGLVMEERLVGLQELAKTKSIATSLNVGPSAMVPPHLHLKADSIDQLQDFAQAAHLGILNVSDSPFPTEVGRESGLPPSVGYRATRSYPTFDVDPMVKFHTFENPRSPRIWTVESDGYLSWSYAPSHAEFLGCHTLGKANVEKISSVDIEVQSAFLPLTAARWIVAVGGVPSGPSRDKPTKYIYRFPSPGMTNDFLSLYRDEVRRQLDIWKTT